MKRSIAVGAAALAFFLLWRRSPAVRGASAIGRLLRPFRCGDARLTANDAALRELPRFDLTSDGFADGGQMAARFVDVPAVQPPLRWARSPAAAVEFALIVEDVDVPFRAPLVHAIAYGIDAARQALPAGAIPRVGHFADRDANVSIGRGAGGRAFLPPTPIPGHGPHRYVFQLFAVREALTFERPPNKSQLINALRRSAIGYALTTGTHEKP